MANFRNDHKICPFIPLKHGHTDASTKTLEKAIINQFKSFPVPSFVWETPPLIRMEAILFAQQDRPALFHLLAHAASSMEVEAHYRHRIELKDSQSLVFDQKRKAAFIIMPEMRPMVPVEFKIITDKKMIGGFSVDSSWFLRFEDQKQAKERMALLQRLNQELVNRASSEQVMAVQAEEARHSVLRLCLRHGHHDQEAGRRRGHHMY